MTTLAHVGRSVRTDARDAGREAASTALDGLPSRRADLCLIFATAGYDQEELLRAVADEVGAAALSGCSGEGVIALREVHECDHAVVVMAIESSDMTFEPLLLRDYHEAPAARGEELAQALARPGESLVSVLVFPDGLRGNCTEFLDSLQASLPAPVVVAGGTAGDAMVFERTYQYCGREAASDAIAAVVIRGAGRMEVAVSHGCAPIGLERRVTDGDGGWVREIDGMPAWNVFKEYLDGDPEDLNAEGIVHLCIGEPLAPEQASVYAPYVIRTPLSLDKESGALFFPGGGLSSGQRIQLTRRDPANIRESAVACATSLAAHRRGGAPALVLQFDCAGRGKVLFGARAAEQAVAPLVDVLGDDIPWIGFHTYGEIAPIADHPYYHNYTVVLCALFGGDD
jgi:hypothetical protein